MDLAESDRVASFQIIQPILVIYLQGNVAPNITQGIRIWAITLSVWIDKKQTSIIPAQHIQRHDHVLSDTYGKVLYNHRLEMVIVTFAFVWSLTSIICSSLLYPAGMKPSGYRLNLPLVPCNSCLPPKEWDTPKNLLLPPIGKILTACQATTWTFTIPSDVASKLSQPQLQMLNGEEMGQMGWPENVPELAWVTILATLAPA